MHAKAAPIKNNSNGRGGGTEKFLYKSRSEQRLLPTQIPADLGSTGTFLWARNHCAAPSSGLRNENEPVCETIYSTVSEGVGKGEVLHVFMPSPVFPAESALNHSWQDLWEHSTSHSRGGHSWGSLVPAGHTQLRGRGGDGHTAPWEGMDTQVHGMGWMHPKAQGEPAGIIARIFSVIPERSR